jgi:lipopolysaccharide export system protein LptA
MIPSVLVKLALLFAITGTCYGLTKELITLEADNICYDYKKNIVYYRGAVIVTQNKTRLTADNMTVYYNQKHQIRKIDAIGKLAQYQTLVHNNKDQLTARAKQILYYPIAATILLKDQATVVYNKNTFSGPFISYDLKQERITSHTKQNSPATIVLEPIKNILDSKK